MFPISPFRVLVVALTAALSPLTAVAGETTTVGDLEISGVWARESIGAARNGAAYMTVKNTGTQADTLIAASSPAAERTEIHEHKRDGDVMRMREVEGGVTIGAGETVTFEPGGYHIMLMNLTKPLVKDETFPVTLTFENAGETTVTVTVKSPKDAMPHGHH